MQDFCGKLSDCISEGSLLGLRRESAVGLLWERLLLGGALSGPGCRAGKRVERIEKCVRCILLRFSILLLLRSCYDFLLRRRGSREQCSC